MFPVTVKEYVALVLSTVLPLFQFVKEYPVAGVARRVHVLPLV